MTVDDLFLLATAGAILSVLFSYFPKLSAWYNGKESAAKQLIMLGLVVLVGLVSYAAACTGFAPDFNLALTCDRAGAIELLKAIVAVAVGNQSTFGLTKRL